MADILIIEIKILFILIVIYNNSNINDSGQLNNKCVNIEMLLFPAILKASAVRFHLCLSL